MRRDALEILMKTWLLCASLSVLLWRGEPGSLRSNRRRRRFADRVLDPQHRGVAAQIRSFSRRTGLRARDESPTPRATSR